MIIRHDRILLEVITNWDNMIESRGHNDTIFFFFKRSFHYIYKLLCAI